MWMAGCIAAMSSVTYPAISAFASSHASADQQGNSVLSKNVNVHISSLLMYSSSLTNMYIMFTINASLLFCRSLQELPRASSRVLGDCVMVWDLLSSVSFSICFMWILMKLQTHRVMLILQKITHTIRFPLQYRYINFNWILCLE